MRPDILTAGGTYFDFTRPQDSAIEIDTIAHALSHLCRFTGHCRQFYSVAQHSVFVSRLVPAEDALAGLLHDAPEAFVGDVAAPLKALLPDYKALERQVEEAVLARFGLPAQLPASVKRADLIALATEQRDLMPLHDDAWAAISGIEPAQDRVVPVGPDEARQMFLCRFSELQRTESSCPQRHATQGRVNAIEASNMAAHRAHRAAADAATAWHAYACLLPVGPDRTHAFAVYERLRIARRVGLD